MIRVFISQPMKGKSSVEIKRTREALTKKAQDLFPYDEVEIVDSYFENAADSQMPLWYLGKSLEVLSQADFAIFANGWQEARGCKIEHECALQYGIGILYD